MTDRVSIHTMPFGAELFRDGVRFRIFAPIARTVRLALDEDRADAPEPLTMQALGDGWHELLVAEAATGTRYRFVLPDGFRVPDPASRFQPEGVHKASEVIDPQAYRWADAGWQGRRWDEAVLYELHVGAFTPEGTFRAAITKLDHLAALGITAIELMCVNAFAGQRSWGYDGVLLYAPDSTYGRPDDLKAFIDAAHARGLMVILDVVYNHFGPEGNYLPKYFPHIFSVKHKTAWGPGLNFDGPRSDEVRELILHNALYWIEEFHMDGLRLDASHAMIDVGERPILEELAERVRQCAGERQVCLILESERRVSRLLARDANGVAKRYDAQWNHAIDHLLGLAMAGDCRPDDENALHEMEELGKAITEGFTGAASEASDSAAEQVPPSAFVSFIQTHDLVGNRVFGQRIHALAPPEAVRAIAAIYLLLPQTPMLLMGEEWAATSPFPFFSDFGGELGEAVRRGRRDQLAKTAHASDEELARSPDPQAESTFRSAKLNWPESTEPAHAGQIDWYRRILAVRRERLVPLLGRPIGDSNYRVLGPGQLEAVWELAGARRLSLSANLCRRPASGFRAVSQTVLWLEGLETEASTLETTLGAWTVRWTLEGEDMQETASNRPQPGFI